MEQEHRNTPFMQSDVTNVERRAVIVYCGDTLRQYIDVEIKTCCAVMLVTAQHCLKRSLANATRVQTKLNILLINQSTIRGKLISPTENIEVFKQQQSKKNNDVKNKTL